jgi:hypothetical protein
MADDSQKEAAVKKNIPKILLRIGVKALFAACILWILFVFASRFFCKAALENFGSKTGTKITAGSMRLRFDGSVEIDNLTIMPDRKDHYDNTILKAEKSRIHLSTGQLFLLRPRLKKITIDNFSLNAAYDCNSGKWNLPSFEQNLPNSGINELPTIYLNNGTFIYGRISENKKDIIAQIPFQAQLVRQKEPISRILHKSEKVFNFELAANQWSNIAPIRLNGTIRDGQIEINGSLLTTDAAQDNLLQAEEIKAVLNYQPDASYLLSADVKGLNSSQGSFAQQFTTVRAFSTDPNLGVRFQNFLDKSQVKGKINAQFNIAGNLYKILQSKIAGKVLCTDIYYCDKGFEYPIEALSGQIDLTEKRVDLNNLQGRHKNSVIFINGWTKDFKENNKYQITVTSDNILLDNDVYSALSDSEKKIWNDFSPAGTVAVDYTIARQAPTNKTSILTVAAQNCSALWNKIRYPLTNVTGSLTFKKGQTTLSNIVSASGSEKIIINGNIFYSEPNSAAFDIDLKAENIEPNSLLNNIAWADLSELARINKPEIIDNIKLTGRINFQGHFKKEDQNKPCDYDIKIGCIGNQIDFYGFPLPFKDVCGNILLQNNRITLEKLIASTDNIGANPAKSAIKFDGQIKTSGNKIYNVVLSIDANDIALDERLGAALPKKMQALYSSLKPTGLVDLNLDSLKIFDSNDSEKCTDINGTINFKKCNFNTTTKLSAIQGRMKGHILYKNTGNLDSGIIKTQDLRLFVSNKLLTGLNAELVYNNQSKNWQSKTATADCYDGKMTGKLDFNEMDEKTSYVMVLGFDGINLQKFLSEPARSETDVNSAALLEKKININDYTRGAMNASLSISGIVGDDKTRIGRCSLNIRNMEVGKVSPLGKLLSILQLTEPRDFTFEQMAVDSYLTGDKLILNVDISGHTTAFQGDGTMELKTMNIDLLLNARGGRPAGKDINPLQTLTEGLGHGIVQIQVKGSIHDPQIETVPFPIIRGTMGLFGTKEKSQKK